MGLSSMWLAVVRAIGVDNFLEMWRILDAHPQNWHDSGRLRVDIRRYAAYRRLQRNRYIEKLHDAGVPVATIHRYVLAAFGEKLTETQLWRIGIKLETRDYYRKREREKERGDRS